MRSLVTMATPVDFSLLRDQLSGPDGATQDVIVLSHVADEAAGDIMLAAPDEAFT